MPDNIQNWMLTIASALIIAGIIAIWKLVASKASRPDLAKIVENFDADIKAVNIRVDQFTALIGQAVSKTDLMKDLGTASTRADDKDLRVQRDITELKADMKTTIEKINFIDKKLDELPSRVTSLETTRNMQK